jgi:hypothetical protein
VLGQYRDVHNDFLGLLAYFAIIFFGVPRHILKCRYTSGYFA